MADDVEITIGATTDDLQSEVARARQSVEAMQESFSALGAIIGTAFAVDKIGEFISSMEELGTQTVRTAAMLGMSVESVSRLNAVSQLVGGSQEGMAKAMERLAFNMNAASAGGKVQQDLFRQLGVSYQDANGKLIPLNDMLLKIADRFKNAPDGPQKTAIAIGLLSRTGAEMIPQLDKGADGIKALGDQAAATGVVLDTKTAKAMDDTGTKATLMKQSFQGLGIILFGEISPALNEFYDEVTKVIEALRKWEAEFGILGTALTKFGELTDTLAGGLATLVRIFEHPLADPKETYKGIMGDEAHQQAQQMLKDFDSLFAAREKFNQPPAATTNFNAPTNQNALKAAQDQANQLIKIQDTMYERQAASINASYKLGQLTEDEKTQALIVAVNTRESVELASLGKVRALYGQGTDEFKKVQNQMTEVEQKADKDREQITQKSLEEQQKLWTQMADKMSGAITGQLRGVLAGTVTFGQAMKNIVGDFILDIIGQFIKMGLEWAAQQLFMLVVKKTTDTAIAASSATASKITLPDRIALFVSTVNADAAMAFAGAFASAAPAGLPAASAAGIAAQGIVLGQLSNVPKYETGIDYVPQDQLAYLHQGEKVTPASENSGGGSTVQFHFNGPVIGSQAWINAMMPQFLAAMKRSQALNPSLA